jgi:uncharacterized sporulation protein YeaH/YhbH (DUF444 family)
MRGESGGLFVRALMLRRWRLLIHGTLMSAYKHLEHQQFLYYVIKEKAEIYQALKTYFRKWESTA